MKMISTTSNDPHQSLEDFNISAVFLFNSMSAPLLWESKAEASLYHSSEGNGGAKRQEKTPKKSQPQMLNPTPIRGKKPSVRIPAGIAAAFVCGLSWTG